MVECPRRDLNPKVVAALEPDRIRAALRARNESSHQDADHGRSTVVEHVATLWQLFDVLRLESIMRFASAPEKARAMGFAIPPTFMEANRLAYQENQKRRIACQRWCVSDPPVHRQISALAVIGVIRQFAGDSAETLTVAQIRRRADRLLRVAQITARSSGDEGTSIHHPVFRDSCFRSSVTSVIVEMESAYQSD